MAQAVAVHSGDNVTQILETQKGVQHHQIQSWLTELARLNPHISDLDRIHPGETLLVPDTLDENIPRADIWRNAFRQIPPLYGTTQNSTTDIYFVQAGDTIDDVVRYMLNSGASSLLTMPRSVARALLIHNNPYLESYLNTPLPPQMMLNITPIKLSEMEANHWHLEQTPLEAALVGMQRDTRQMFDQAGAQTTKTVGDTVEELERQGFAVGMDDVVKFAGYGVGGTSGAAASASMSVSRISALMVELNDEAIKKFGKSVVQKANAFNLKKLQNFLLSHPKYSELTTHLKKLPKSLLPKGDWMSPNFRNYPIARHFRRHVSLPLKHFDRPTAYVNRLAKQLNGRVQMFNGAGRAFTWYIPAALGVANVAMAPPEKRMRTLFSEGFGVIGGALGSLGASYAGAYIASIFVLGPAGAFLVVFVCASLGGGILSEAFKGGAGKIYDAGSIVTDRIFYSPNEVVGQFYE